MIDDLSYKIADLAMLDVFYNSIISKSYDLIKNEPWFVEMVEPFVQDINGKKRISRDAILKHIGETGNLDIPA